MQEQCFVHPVDLRCEYRVNPLGIDEPCPRLFWRLEASETARGVSQKAYQVRVATSREKLQNNEGDLWDTGRVESQQNTHVVYEGAPLSSAQRVYWQVRIWDQEDRPSDWSHEAWWETGLLERDNWQADWIGPQTRPQDQSQPPPMFRRSFRLDKEIKDARLYVAARGLCRPYVNGLRPDDDELTPGWTNFHKRVQYMTYNVTPLLQQGENAIGLLCGDGWYSGYLASFQRSGRGYYGSEPQILAQMVIRYKGGESETIPTDSTWKWSTGGIRASDIYNGEVFDAREVQSGWAAAAFDDDQWQTVEVYEDQGEKRTAKKVDPVRPVETITPVNVTQPEPGTYIVDMGQNMVGRVRVRMRGRAGETLRIRHGEALDADGNLYTANLRKAAQTNTYTFADDNEIAWEPVFTFQGFRYVELSGGMAETPDVNTITGVVLHNTMPRTGAFACSDSRLNQLQHNIVWGQKGNYLEVPTDCPQRDERLGWTGDAQVFIRTACHNFNVAPFITKWMDDLTDDQADDGCVPNVAPDVLTKPGAEEKDGGASVWGDALIIVPWTMYLCYGDTRLFERHYEAMCKWIEYQENTCTNFIRPAEWFGDWLAMDAPGGPPSQTATPKDMVATAYFAHVAHLMSRIASVLKRNDEAERFSNLSQQITEAFQQEFVTPAGRILGDTQTAYALPLAFNLLPVDKRDKAIEKLVSDIQRNDNHITTGFAGGHILPYALSSAGRYDVNYDLLFQETCPSWLFPVIQGATTIWERWDGWTPENGFQTPSMNSFNHYAYGAIGEWLYRICAGLNTAEEGPGFKQIVFDPVPDMTQRRLTWARTAYTTLHGDAEIYWSLNAIEMSVDVLVPPNTEGCVKLPAASAANVKENGTALEEAEGVLDWTSEENRLCIRILSGRYHFACSVSEPDK